LAKFFLQELEKRGIKCTGDPVVGEGGWTIFLSVGPGKFILFFQWLPVGRPAKDYWVIQPSEELEPILSHIRAILENEKRIAEISWLTFDEFGALCLPDKSPGDVRSN